MQKDAALPNGMMYDAAYLTSKGNSMTPALTLSLSAQTMRTASAVIGQQMRLAHIVIDQTYAAHRALVTPYLSGPAKPMAKKKVAKPTAKKSIVAKQVAKK